MLSASAPPDLPLAIDARQIHEAQMKRFKFLLFAALLVGFAALAHAGFDDGKAAYGRGGHAKAYEEFKGLAEPGNATAQYTLGCMYDKGQGVPKNDFEAAKCFRKSAEQRLAGAQIDLDLAIMGEKK